MNRNKLNSRLNPTASRPESSTNDSVLWSKKRQRSQGHVLSSVPNNPHNRSSQHGVPSTNSLLRDPDLYDDDDDDFVQVNSKKQKRSNNNSNKNNKNSSNSSTHTTTTNKSRQSSTEVDYTPDPHDKSDFQHTHRSNSTAQRSHISTIGHEFHRFSGASLASRKQPSPLSRKSPSHATHQSFPSVTSFMIPPRTRKRPVALPTQPPTVQPSRSSSPSLTISPRPRKRPAAMATGPPTVQPSRSSLSLSTAKAQQKSPSTTQQSRLILPTRHKPSGRQTTIPQEDIHIDKKQRSNNPPSEALFLPKSRREKNDGPRIPSNVFILPGKHLAKKATDPSFAPLPDLAAIETDDMKVECPYCHADLDLSQSETLVLAYEEIKLKDNRYENQVLDEESMAFRRNEYSSSHAKRRIRRPVSNIDQYAFCQLHVAELELKPEGDRNGWPSTIPFDTLKARIYDLRHELELVISKRVISTYRNMALEAYESLGKNKARSTVVMMSRFQRLLPGYYGTRGASVIQEHLAEMYLHNGRLTKDITAPQSSMEYLQHVLIPEVGFRLIREDLIEKDPSQRHNPDIDLEARRVMAESSFFGSCLQPMDDGDDDEDAVDPQDNQPPLGRNYYDDNDIENYLSTSEDESPDDDIENYLSASEHGSHTIYEISDDDDDHDHDGIDNYISPSKPGSHTVYIVSDDDDDDDDDNRL